MSGPAAVAAGDRLTEALAAVGQLAGQLEVIERWGRDLAAVLSGGGRVLAAGNGGSAAQAQHFSAELVGRYLTDRQPLSAIALGAEAPAATAVANDFGAEDVFARQVRAHGRPGDVLLLLSTSGRSPNVVAAARAGRCGGLRVLGLTGERPNPLAEACHESIAVTGVSTPSVQEAQLVAVHLLCAAVDDALATAADTGRPR